jgi:hypothetical protein
MGKRSERSAILSIESVKLKPKLLSPLSLSVRSSPIKAFYNPESLEATAQYPQVNERQRSNEDFEVQLCLILKAQFTLEVSQ